MSELTFTSADDLLRHYADVRKRLNAGPATPIPGAAPMAHIEKAEAAALEATPAHTMVDQALAPLVVGASNIIAVTMLRRLLLDDLPGRLLYLYGPEGTGKTLMATLARKVLPPTRLRLVDRAETAAPFECSRVMGGVIRGLAFGRNPPSECQGGEALARAVSVEIDLPCPEVRLGVLRREASRLSRGVGQDVLAALAEADVPLLSALGTLRTLVMTARQVDVASAMELLERARVPAGPRRVKIDDIQQVVCQHYGISRADILSHRRTAKVVFARQIAMYLAKTLTLRSLPEIGRRFGGRDHTTVLHAVRKIEGLSRPAEPLAGEISALKELIDGGVRP